MKLSFENILQESDLTEYTGEVIYKHETWLSAFSNGYNFISIIELEITKAINEDKNNRFCFISHLLFRFGRNLAEHKTIYCKMIDYINQNFKNKSSQELEQCLTIVLDLFWHQDNGLRDFNDIQQEGLSLLLRNSAAFKYQIIDENGDYIFFAIKMSLDLIKFQKNTGNTEEIVSLYLNHFDTKIRQEVIEMKSKNWL